MASTTQETSSAAARGSTEEGARLKRRLALGTLAFDATVVPAMGLVAWREHGFTADGFALLAGLALVAGLSLLLMSAVEPDPDASPR